MLSLSAVKKAEARDRDYKLYDERGLYLLVKKSGAKYWRFKYRFQGKEKTLAFGVFPEVTLTEARDKRDQARLTLRGGTDPGTNRPGKIDEAELFRTIASDWLEARGPKSATGDARLKAIVANDLLPEVGADRARDIQPTRWLEVIRKIEARGAIETARRANQYGGQIFRFGIATGRCESDPTQLIKDALVKRKGRHFSAITSAEDFGKLLVSIDEYMGTAIVRAALKLSPLLFCRPGELRHLEWPEVNFDERQIEIPGHKMKIGEPHIIPLSNQAFAVLEHCYNDLRRGQYVFYSARGASRPLSENAVRVALRTMGYDNDTMTAHGFRATARTLLDEVLEYPVDWIEHQLAHAVRDVNGRAYNRTKHLKQRREMMQGWADYCDRLKASASAVSSALARARETT